MHATALVMRPTQSVLTLSVEVADGLWFPDVEQVLRALQEQHGVEAVVLDCLSEEPLTYLMLLTGGEPTSSERAWTKPTWYDGALPWIDEHVTRTGPWSQVRSWGLSNVLRLSTTQGTVYFKALAHSSTIESAPGVPPLLFAHEPLFLDRVSTERPGEVPAPLAIDEKRVWMLLPDLGTPLAHETDLEVWIDAVRRHARLQRSYAGQVDRLLEFSCVDRRLAVLEGELDRLFGPNEATERLDPAERAKLPRRADQLREAMANLRSIGLPDTLIHGDLHPRNIAVQGNQVMAFDWTDSAVSHPFLDLVTFVEERSPTSSDPRVLDAYLREWEEYAAPKDLRRALELAEQLGALHQLMTSLNLPEHLTGPSRDSMFRGAVWWLQQVLSGAAR
ncbi:aminoglycoside phosphotransferase family protein [Kribbella sp. NPDC026611]|uniref:aminoglycoside phosphotransferase family protein n=1 Tax=Kribbella sp. NPDC026611 TaxID=3154911 RepID=UPI0033F8B604